MTTAPNATAARTRDTPLYAETIARHGRPRIGLLDYRFLDQDASQQANRHATFHPQTDYDSLSCVEVDGVLVFAYLAHEARAVKASVYLDSAANRLLRPGS
ncbi:hypothetical protein [Streptomyces sp. NPDC021356]|uniref:hypothetical protein n=1 Tax=Streptomyces sp. NPDC021356 TaxID=3154900 RepID=UPI0033E0A1F1